MKEKLIELMKELNFYNRSEGIVELEECDVEIMAKGIIKLYNLHFVMQQREQLLAYEKSLYTESDWNRYARESIEEVVDNFLANNCA